MDELKENKLGLQVLTDTGWSNFRGVLNKGTKQTFVVKTQSQTITATPDHKFLLKNLTIKQAEQLKPGDRLYGRFQSEKVVSVKIGTAMPVYDLFEVEKNHRFFANNLLVSNCEFIIWDETLINPSHLVELTGIEPLERQGQVRWYKKPTIGNTYVVGLDPSLGTGGDPAAIQVYELPSFHQVAEWQHNKTPVQRQVSVLAEITAYLSEIVPQTSVYYSVENNSLGEAALVTIAEIGEENIKGIFLSESRRSGGNRKGFTTTPRSKLATCAKLKNLIESKRLTVSSKSLVTELKTFVRNGASFAAKPGETDDLVMSLVLVVRMAQMLQSYDATLDDAMRDTLDEIISPLPFIMM